MRAMMRRSRRWILLGASVALVGSWVLLREFSTEPRGHAQPTAIPDIVDPRSVEAGAATPVRATEIAAAESAEEPDPWYCARVVGRVVDSAGTAIPGARVEMTCPGLAETSASPGSASHDPVQAVSDPAGRFALESVPAGYHVALPRAGEL